MEVESPACTFASGIGINNQYVAWGCAFVDYDNDGWTDIIQVNGHVYSEIGGHDWADLQESAWSTKTWATGNSKRFLRPWAQALPSATRVRGAAFGDYDNDGDIDALVLNMGALPSLLRNDGGNQQNWIKIKPVGTKCNRTAIGARVRVVTGSHSQIDEVLSGSSVISPSDLRLHFGLGKASVVDVIAVKWPATRKIERFTQVKANQILTVRKGGGIVVPASTPAAPAK